MDTHHHTVSVRVKSVLDSCDDDEGPDDKAMMELQASQQVSTSQAPLAVCRSSSCALCLFSTPARVLLTDPALPAALVRPARAQ
jgi:hypothetical protein